MTKIEENSDEEWTAPAKLKTGPIPFAEPDRSQTGSYWSSPPANSFMVRGPHYFKTKTKIPASNHLGKLLAFDWIKGGDRKISDVLGAYPKHRVRRAVEDASAGAGDAGQRRPRPFVFAFNFQLPTKDHHSIVAYFYTHHAADSTLMGRFLAAGDGDGGFRDSRLKLIVNVVKGPWVVTKAIGQQAVSLIGRSLACAYHCSEENGSMEVDIDVGSSMVAAALFRLCFGYFKSTTVDMAFVIEAKEESELPEQVLGAFRFSGLDESLAVEVGDA